MEKKVYSWGGGGGVREGRSRYSKHNYFFFRLSDSIELCIVELTRVACI